MEQNPNPLSELQERAARAENRAAQAREHSSLARDAARRDAEQGHREAERGHLREADAHEGAARSNAKTAGLYHDRIHYLRGREGAAAGRNTGTDPALAETLIELDQEVEGDQLDD